MPVHTHFQAGDARHLRLLPARRRAAAGRDLDAIAAAADGLRRARWARARWPAPTCRSIRPHPPGCWASPATPGTRWTRSRAGTWRCGCSGAAAGLIGALSRLAADLQLWSSAEFGFVAFPDRLVGGSSAMPQKRNAFLLEHLKAKPGAGAGRMGGGGRHDRRAPFTNSIEVGTEAMTAYGTGSRACVRFGAAEPSPGQRGPAEPGRMRDAPRDGFTVATSIANRLVRRGMPFRAAHHLVGEAVRAAIEAGSTDLAAFGPPAGWTSIGLADLDLAELCATTPTAAAPVTSPAAPRRGAGWAQRGSDSPIGGHGSRRPTPARRGGDELR